MKFLRRPEPVRTAEGLEHFLTGEAALLAQKSTIEYCRARAGLQWQKLFAEAAFLKALERCRWEAFSLVLADIIVLVESRLRRLADGRSLALAEALATLYEGILLAHPLPAHRADWQDRMAELRSRLGRAQLAEPARTEEIAGVSGRAVFDLLPIHPSLRGHDRLMIFNHIRFGMLTFAERFDHRVDAPAAISALLDGQRST
ncbi:MAG TPA: hypothetical protein VED46_05510 [Alphaproteobacteria bacterium]|nr:hypothetical protein [Alphaproteobacteria bacterium]